MDTTIDTRTVRLVRTFDAPRERVFAAWTNPDQFVQWMCPPGYGLDVCELDVRPGGAWRIDGRHDGPRVFSSSGNFQPNVWCSVTAYVTGAMSLRALSDMPL